MALQWSRDRSSHRLFPPQPPPPSGPPPPQQPMVGSAPPQHIPLAALQQYHQQHQQQQQQQQQQQRQMHHQVQTLYPQRDVVLHGQGPPSGMPVLAADLAMAAAYRQMSGQQPPVMLGPQRMQGWDDRHAGPLPQQRLDTGGSEGNMRLDSGNVLLDPHGRVSDGRIVTSYRPFEKQEIRPGHERNVYWQTSGTAYAGDVIVPRSYQRTPSPSPQRIRQSGDRYLENDGHFNSRFMATPSSRPHAEREVRKRSRERSPVHRIQRVSRIPEHASSRPNLPDLSIPVIYRQRGAQQSAMLSSQRMQPPAGWDDRSIRHAGPGPLPQRLDAGGNDVNVQHISRLEPSSASMNDHTRFSDGRLVTNFRPFEKQDLAVHRPDNWQPPNPMYPDDVIPPRTFQRTPSPSSQRIRANGECYDGNLSSRVNNKRSRERSPIHRFQRLPMPLEQGSRPKQNYGRRHTDAGRNDDEDREDGEVTPTRSPDAHEEGRREHVNSRALNCRQAYKRERTGFRDHGSPAMKSRFEERTSQADLSGEASSKKMTSTGHKQAPRESNGPQDAIVTRNAAAPANSGQAVPFRPFLDREIPKAVDLPTANGQSSVQPQQQQQHHQQQQLNQQQQQHQQALSTTVGSNTPQPETGIKDNERLAVTTSIVNTSVARPLEGTEKTLPTTEKSVVPAAKEKTSANAEKILPTVEKSLPAVEKSLPAEKPGSVPESQRPVPAKEVDSTQKAVAFDGKQTKQAVLTIRKNPSMPVAFKPRTTATSKTWHRAGNLPGVSKLSNVFTAGSTGAQAPANANANASANGAAYIRKGNSLVRTAPAPAPLKQTPIHNSSPLRAAVLKKAGHLNNFKPVEVGRPATPPAVPSGEQAQQTTTISTETEKPASKSPKAPPAMKTKLGKALRLKKKSATSSWVWTLNASNKAPSLLPWKKRLRRKVKVSKGKKGSLISKKLQALRTSQPLYTRSANGFALHRSGTHTVDGASFIWATKALEKRPANEEATKVMAVLDKRSRKDGENGVEKITKGPKSRERIVLVGLVRYKMDPSERTVQRIQESPDSETSTALVSSSNGSFSASAMLAPRRSSVGGAVYVRMGNGNQLVRDTNKVSSRALAIERIRWSLHNVRSRVAKKQQYCQFFTRFGKCNKGSGKCPYIHDPDKVVVCTKFLKGTCTNTSCLFTHKVIPERMPDCSYFLQGSCSNKECSYRHVNVNPDAPVCEGFLKGYCASGDKCTKRHTYVCPAYASSGDCPDRKTCKFHHPKKKEKSGLKNKKRRYFIGSNIPPSRPLAVPQDKPSEFDSGTTEFISLQGITLDDFVADEEPTKDSASSTGAEVDRLVSKPPYPQQEVQ